MRAEGIVVAVVFAATLCAAPCVAGAQEAAQRPIDFNRDIRPILSDNCYSCHGHDAGHRKAELRLDTREGLFGERDETFPVVPGKPDDSVLYMRITSDDPEYLMPHHESNKKLTPVQIELLKRWIEEGAPWKGHWAYEKPERPAPPPIKSADFVQNDIDRFILARLKDARLNPSPDADRVTLIRRLKLDLLGLPPTYAEVQAFVNDKSENAYSALVERFLSAPQHGERMSVFWMDLVRYADTIGFHSDNPREVWPYRDWVIKAFNENKPFDEFTREQIAGDLLPGSTREQKVASAYNRLLLTTGEGGSQPKEYVKKYEADRVRNVSTTWMGVTMGCAQCHDHKFDPFTARDFYRMAAFFADIQEPAITLPQPELLLTTPEQQAQLDKFDAGIAEARRILDTPTPELAAAQEAFEKQYHAEKDKTNWQKLEITSAKSEGGATLEIQKDKATILASGSNPPTDTYEVRTTTQLKNITALKVEALPHKSLPARGPGRASNGNFVATEIDVTYPVGPTTRPVAFTAATASHEQADASETNPYRKFPALAAVDGDKYGDKLGWAILPRTGQSSYAAFETAADLGTGEPLDLTIKLKFSLGDAHSLGHFRLWVTDAPRPVRAVPDKGIPGNIVRILELSPDKRSDGQKAALAAHYRSIAPALQPQREQIAALTKQREALIGPPVNHMGDIDTTNRIPRTLITVSGPPRVTRVLNRGDWQDETGEIVAPGVPAFMRQIDVPVDRGASRLDLANWLVAGDNPLTARVFVNRLWKMFHGGGLARPLDDLGAQGEWPSHPELLDWLAVEFMESGWDIRHMIRLMVTSGTYRQSSRQDQPLREADPFNRLLARQAAFRLDAEFVRDNALAVSGLLVETIGGPSVKPYQPEGYWEFLNFPKRTYKADTGESLYRRGLYTWWQRTFLNPSLLNFDASTHEECTAERVRSNTPQQALTLLNDPTYVEAARAFAARILTECDGEPAARISWAFRTALSRDPLPKELPVLLSLLEGQRERYRFDMPAADALTSVGESKVGAGLKTAELAAWTSVARTILNLHETITRD